MYHPDFALLKPDAEGRDESGLRKSISVARLRSILDQLDADSRICINLTTCNLSVLNREYEESIGYIDLLNEEYEEL